MTPLIQKIQDYFKQSSSADVYEYEVRDTKIKVSKLADNSYQLTDSNTNQSFKLSDTQLETFTRFMVDSAPEDDSLALKDRLAKIKLVLNTKKQDGTIIESENNVFTTPSGLNYEIKPAFNTLWISKHTADGGTFYNQSEPEFSNLLKELYSTGFIGDSVIPLHWRFISDAFIRVDNLPGTLTQELVLKLIRENAITLNKNEVLFNWAIEGSFLDSDSPPTIYLLVNGEKAAKPYISGQVLKFEVFNNKELLKQILPEFEMTRLKKSILPVSDALKVADSISANNLRLFTPGGVIDIFISDNTKAILVNGVTAAVTENTFSESAPVLQTLEIPLVKQALDMETLYSQLEKAVIFSSLLSFYYGFNCHTTSGPLAERVKYLFEDAKYSLSSTTTQLLSRLVALGGNVSHCANIYTWAEITGVQPIVTDPPYDTATQVSNAMAQEHLVAQSINALISYTKDGDPVTHAIMVDALGSTEKRITRLQEILINLNS